MTNRKNWGIGASTCFFGRFDREVAAAYSTAGVKYVELSHSELDYREKLKFLDAPEAIRAIADEAGITLRSLHIPFSGSVQWASPDENNRTRNVKLAKEYIAASAKAGISINVIHPSTEPIPQNERRLYFEQCVKSMTELSEYAENEGVKLAVENLPRTCLCRDAVEMTELVKRCPKIYVCFDTNHNLREPNVNFIRTVTQNGGRIATLHISDYDFTDEKHWMPGTENSKNDWQGIISELEAANYNGTFTYEISSRSKYTLHDLCKNAENLLGQ